MAVMDIFRPVAPVHAVGGRLLSNIAAAYSFVADWRAARATAKQLSMLSDHELSDIGLGRGDIASVASRAFR